MIWHVLKVAPQRERWVEMEIKRGLGLATCVPCVRLYRKARGKGGKPTLIPYHQPIFPSYVMVGSHDSAPWFDLSQIKHVHGRIMFGSIPATLSTSEIDRIRLMAKDVKPESARSFAAGDAIKITSGPFASFETIIREIRPDGVRIELELFGRATPMIMAPDQIERAAG